MPLASRATQARADRQGGAAASTKSDEGDQKTQPRKPSTAASKPAPEKKAPPAQETSQDGAAAQESATAGEAPPVTETPARRGARGPDKAPRAPRSRPTPVTAVGETIDKAAIKARMKDIEVEAKTLNQEHAGAVRDLERSFAERRRALQDEHRGLAAQLSDAVFGG